MTPYEALSYKLLSLKLINSINRFQPMTNGTIITRIQDAIVMGSEIVESAQNEVMWLAPRPTLVYASQFGIIEKFQTLIQKGVTVRGISDLSYVYIDTVRELLDIGQNVRHFEKYQGVFMVLGDGRKSISTISVDAENLSIDDPVVAFWCEDPTYIEYLTSTFELVWEQAIPAAQRIEELLKEGPPDT
ncbi:MAG TPA: hypothetical protein VED16_00945 [Candidatus Acidoferrum sp.]|nr:hypothetical protein [Candidatus Acidoferrum sp.]